MKKLLFTILAAAICLSAAAQDLNTAYFLDGYKYRHRLNPAFAPTRSYFGLPALGGVSLYTQSDMGMNTFLYPVNGQLTTFMSSAVQSDEFLSKLKKNNDLGVGLNLNMLSLGIWGENGFTSAELNLKVNAAANIPYDLFDFMKNVGTRQSYNISNMDVKARSYVELALGHAHSINEHLNIGAKVKFLVGIADADAHIDNLNVQMNGEKWSVTADGNLTASVPGLVIPTMGETGASTDPAQADQIDFNGISITPEDILSDLQKSQSFGAALDLGAEYRFDGLLEGLNVSAAVLDLGFISWGDSFRAATAGGSWEFSGFENIEFDENSENSIGKQFESLGNDLQELIVFKKQAAGNSRTSMLNCTLNLGAEYEMPFYRKLSFGFLYTSRIAGPYSMNEGRFSANVNPTKWFGFSASYGISNYGSAAGAVINFDLPGFGLFVGTDCAIWNVTPPVEALGGISVPYGKLNLNATFGLVFNIGKYRTLGDRR